MFLVLFDAAFASLGEVCACLRKELVKARDDGFVETDSIGQLVSSRLQMQMNTITRPKNAKE